MATPATPASGQILPKAACLDEWALVLHKCETLIAVNAVLCKGPKHFLTFNK